MNRLSEIVIIASILVLFLFIMSKAYADNLTDAGLNESHRCPIDPNNQSQLEFANRVHAAKDALRHSLLENGHSEVDKLNRELFKMMVKDTQQTVLEDLKNDTKPIIIPC